MPEGRPRSITRPNPGSRTTSSLRPYIRNSLAGTCDAVQTLVRAEEYSFPVKRGSTCATIRRPLRGCPAQSVTSDEAYPDWIPSVRSTSYAVLLCALVRLAADASRDSLASAALRSGQKETRFLFDWDNPGLPA